MGLFCNHFNLLHLLVWLKQFFVCAVDEVTNAVISDALAEPWEVESGDHVLPVFSHQVSDGK